MAGDDEKQKPGKKTLAVNNPRLEQLQRQIAAKRDKPKVSTGQFFKEAWHELQPPRTAWPSPMVLQKSTMVVLALILAVGIWVGSLDFILTRLLNPIMTGS
jgi:preprotein translocase subunit SecE